MPLPQMRSDQPVYMLNLLKYKQPAGAALYAEYATAATPILKAHGARIIYAGKALKYLINDASNTEWDTVVIVRYPSIKDFKRMLDSAAYQEILHLRHDSLSNSVLCAMESVDTSVGSTAPSPKL